MRETRRDSFMKLAIYGAKIKFKTGLNPDPVPFRVR
ncbi:MAG: hypothetical protein OJF48_000459 [Afipia sp.]|jgi:hypothetical protein|nr:MAG: hypothetical protein OJF48_000459 [Afipia sp.]